MQSRYFSKRLSRQLLVIFGLLLVAGLLASCQQGTVEPAETPTVVEPGETPPVAEPAETPTVALEPSPTAEPTSTPEGEEGGGLPPAAVLAAQRALAEVLGVSPEELETVSFAQREWPNACLGLAQAGEMCAEVITPGYLVTLALGDETYQVRSNLEATNVRIEGMQAGPSDGTPAPGAGQPAAVANARQALAERLGIAVDAVEALSYEPHEWPDSCLGLGGPAEICAQVMTTGFLVMLRAEGQVYEAHTNRAGGAVRFAGAPVAPGRGAGPEPLIVLQRSGGVAGQAVEWRIYADGRLEKASGLPGSEQAVETGTVGNRRLLPELLDDLEATGFFDLDGAYMLDDACCDRYHYRLSATLDGQSNTVETVEGTEDLPPAVWESISLIESFLDEHFPGPAGD